jgi:hypothetical protein
MTFVRRESLLLIVGRIISDGYLSRTPFYWRALKRREERPRWRQFDRKNRSAGEHRHRP